MAIEIKTSLSNAAGLNLVSSIFAGVAFTAILYFTKDANLKESILLGFTVFLVGVIYSLVRFVFTSPKVLFINEDELHIAKRNGNADLIVWSSVLKAAHSTFLGMKWTLYLSERTVIIHDDGITRSDWNVLSKAICKSLESRHKPINTDLIGRATVEMD